MPVSGSSNDSSSRRAFAARSSCVCSATRSSSAAARSRSARVRIRETPASSNAKSAIQSAYAHGVRYHGGSTRNANARLEELSFDDPLTGIANRRRLDLVLRSEWLRARRSRLPLGLILIDIDLFKQLNDTHGHQEGDVCLQHVARLLSRSVQRSGELTARYGGEEFAIVLPNTDLEGCHRLAEHLRAGIQALAIPHEGSPTGTLTASFGVSSMTPSESNEVDDLVASADRALYEAKAAGRNRVRSAA